MASGMNIGAINNGNGSSDNLPSQFKVLTIAFNQDFTYEFSRNYQLGFILLFQGIGNGYHESVFSVYYRSKK